ncbi:hypothetical protein RJ639_030755, partial [Escallonia herrerae]
GSGSTSDTRTNTSHHVSQLKKLKVSILVRFQKKPSPFLNWWVELTFLCGASRTEKFVQQCINSEECVTIRFIKGYSAKEAALTDILKRQKHGSGPRGAKQLSRPVTVVIVMASPDIA